MTLYRKCAIFLVIMYTMRSVTQCSGSEIGNDVSEDTDEDEKLKQALVLVDLLKNEYVKALRENYQLRKKGTTPEEEPTCASADETTSSTSSSLETSAVTSTTPQPAAIISIPVGAPNPINGPGSGRRLAGLTPLTFPQLPALSGGIQPYGLLRRRAPIDYYYGNAGVRYDYPIRRKVAFRRQESNVEKTTAAPKTNPNENTERELPTDTLTTTAMTEEETVTEIPNTNTEQELSTKAITDLPDENEPTDADDPLQSQIASELIQELKLKSSKDPKNIKIFTEKATSFLPLKYESFKLKPTLKIHLGGSTRYPIPLPENHAFCYTNPRNQLCRTAI